MRRREGLLSAPPPSSGSSRAQPKPSKQVSGAFAALVILSYAGSSVLYLWINRYIFVSNAFHLPVFVSWFQQLITFLLSLTLVSNDRLPVYFRPAFPKVEFTVEDTFKAFGSSVAFAGMIVLQNMTLRELPVAAYHLAKCTTLVFIALLSGAVLGVRTSRIRLLGVGFVLLGFILGVADASYIPPYPALLGTLASLFGAYYLVSSKKTLAEEKMPLAVLLQYNQLVSALLLPPFISLCEEFVPLTRVLEQTFSSWSQFGTFVYKFWGPLIFSGILGVFLSLSCYASVRVLSPLGLSLVSQAKTVAQILGATVLFKEALDARTLGIYVVVGAGMLWYTLLTEEPKSSGRGGSSPGRGRGGLKGRGPGGDSSDRDQREPEEEESPERTRCRPLSLTSIWNQKGKSDCAPLSPSIPYALGTPDEGHMGNMWVSRDGAASSVCDSGGDWGDWTENASVLGVPPPDGSTRRRRRRAGSLQSDRLLSSASHSATDWQLPPLPARHHAISSIRSRSVSPTSRTSEWSQGTPLPTITLTPATDETPPASLRQPFEHPLTNLHLHDIDDENAPQAWPVRRQMNNFLVPDPSIFLRPINSPRAGPQRTPSHVGLRPWHPRPGSSSRAAASSSAAPPEGDTEEETKATFVLFSPRSCRRRRKQQRLEEAQREASWRAVVGMQDGLMAQQGVGGPDGRGGRKVTWHSRRPASPPIPDYGDRQSFSLIHTTSLPSMPLWSDSGAAQVSVSPNGTVSVTTPRSATSPSGGGVGTLSQTRASTPSPAASQSAEGEGDAATASGSSRREREKSATSVLSGGSGSVSGGGSEGAESPQVSKEREGDGDGDPVVSGSLAMEPVAEEEGEEAEAEADGETMQDNGGF
uniref:Sugar phosphate transporter domain-containing protein n=1 Tax=Chromera velia CCMP2878 TaxID=1169474 RepID=A0A0G4FFX8_9ALVE|eukprot:Cvel_3287.t1-p1 / transcript=Cvel_3287.t1 / gene=Cvel_3287 / organism=Chromera_velia_CCMP2878 / gene_product=GDP-fucose transporter 1, putative / transcript_product=GDP-fucose transporter 1, putative / location=Cvel_scaffold129:81092-83692(-) / protein_length=867 / sequence_SO=supercontig / SO=protein_coding / is_pseudo=false